jgi:hypothetical protein
MMKQLIALTLLTLIGFALAQDIESQKKYAPNETIKLSTLGISIKFPYVVFGNLNDYGLNSGELSVGFQPGVTQTQVKAGIEAAVLGQYQSLKLKGGVNIRGDLVTARYYLPDRNTYWRIVYRKGPQGQGVIFSVQNIANAVDPNNETKVGNALTQFVKTVKFFAPQNAKLEPAWKKYLDQKWALYAGNTHGTDILRFCNDGTAFFRGETEFPRLSLIQGWAANDVKKQIKLKWKLYPVNAKIAFLILEYGPNDVRTLEVHFNDGSDGSTPSLKFGSSGFYLKTALELTERKLNIPDCGN